MRKKPIVLAILDGYGISDSSAGNAIYEARTPQLDRIFQTYPTACLEASEMAVGLPEGQMGNSEVGHTSIGAGRVVYQELTRINKAIRDGNFFTNPVLTNAMDKVSDQNTLHIMGLLSDGGVHSHIGHIMALVAMAAQRKISSVKLHCFLDGRDVAPTSGAEFVHILLQALTKYPQASIATVTGRFYAMDRDNRWDRVERAYDAIAMAKGQATGDFTKDIEKFYLSDITDEFIPPLIGNNYTGAKTNDQFIFANFRPDRARELTRALADPTFASFKQVGRPAVGYTTMTSYDASMDFVNVVFEAQSLKNTLGELVSTSELKQLRIAETEKYAHVTFFFSGGLEQPLPGEDRILIPSPAVTTYDQMPQMSAFLVTEALLEALQKNIYDLVVLNLANCDMVGHTGVFDAAVHAVEAVDTCIGKIADKVLAMDGLLLITADHGNADQMFDDEGNVMTAHSMNPVPFCIAGSQRALYQNGALADIAPTIIELLELEKPIQMDGRSLLKA